MVINITECMQYPARSFAVLTGRRKCKHLDKGAFGGYVCKFGHRIDSIPKISKDSITCRDKEVSRYA